MLVKKNKIGFVKNGWNGQCERRFRFIKLAE